MKIISIAVPELRCAGFAQRGKGMQNVVGTDPDIHVKISVGNLQDGFLQGKTS